MTLTRPAIQDQIIALSHEWIDAIGRRDAIALDRIIHDDFLIAGWRPDGQLCNKTVYIDDCLIPVSIEDGTFSHRDWNFRVYDDIALASSIFECHATVAGQPWGGTFILSDVWKFANDSWTVVARHSSPVQKSIDAAQQAS